MQNNSDPDLSPSGESSFKSKSGFSRIAKAASYSYDGLKAAWQHEHAFKQELMLCLVLLPVALFLPVSLFERVAMIACLFALLIVELINSAIEAVVDRVSLDRHPLSKRAKDLGSAAVLLTFLMGIMVWGAVAFRLASSLKII
jgi:diacylglycerol kinase (ATP)